MNGPTFSQKSLQASKKLAQNDILIWPNCIYPHVKHLLVAATEYTYN